MKGAKFSLMTFNPVKISGGATQRFGKQSISLRPAYLGVHEHSSQHMGSIPATWDNQVSIRYSPMRLV